MRRWLAVFFLVCAAGAVSLYFWLRSGSPPSLQEIAPAAKNSTAAAIENVPAKTPQKAEPVAPAPPAESSARSFAAPPPSLAASAGQLQAPVEPEGIPPQAALASMRRTVRQYNQMFGGNPIGTNPEITRALNGDNPRHVNFLQPDGNHVNEKGELVDPWGTPYFFHQLSASEMEIRSAGPDKVMYTGDDLVTK
jgi:hypothetical protein